MNHIGWENATQFMMLPTTASPTIPPANQRRFVLAIFPAVKAPRKAQIISEANAIAQLAAGIAATYA